MTRCQKLSLTLTASIVLLAIPFVGALADDTVSITLPQETSEYKPGTGQELAKGYCLTCHAADYVYMQPPMAKDKWVGVVNKMKKVFGCPVPDTDVDRLADYLAGQNGMK